ncbi:hypothetical protein CVT25_011038 [Psilocybe cyanescens]|uniref:Uncharacterized protein n=1 Tax=Psilocybe cyanescens TaxID=93625 RepID=A0A409WFA4_PSICY|nr:hypothetical protein CVT25_011038 [Psilocybe cyanescens]
MAAKFLCCLPLRLGVIIISFCQFFFCGALAGLLWYTLSLARQNGNDLSTITQTMKTTVIVVAAIYTFAALVGLLGFFGALFKKNGFVKSFYILLCIVFGLEVGSSIWYLVTFYRTRGQTLEQCINGSAEPSRVAYCKSLDAYKRVPQGAMLASIIVPILIHAYACYIVYQYTKRLEYQKIEKLRASRSFPQTQPIYQAVNPHDESFPLAQPNPQYPYADGANSFGHVHQNLFGGNNASNKV